MLSGQKTNILFRPFFNEIIMHFLQWIKLYINTIMGQETAMVATVTSYLTIRNNRINVISFESSLTQKSLK